MAKQTTALPIKVTDYSGPIFVFFHSESMMFQLLHNIGLSVRGAALRCGAVVVATETTAHGLEFKFSILHPRIVERPRLARVVPFRG